MIKKTIDSEKTVRPKNCFSKKINIKKNKC